MNISDILPLIGSYSSGIQGMRLVCSEWNEILNENDQQILQTLSQRYSGKKSTQEEIIAAITARDSWMIDQVVNIYRSYLPVHWNTVAEHVQDKQMLYLMRDHISPDTYKEVSTYKLSSDEEILKLAKDMSMSTSRGSRIKLAQLRRYLIKYKRYDLWKELVDLYPIISPSTEISHIPTDLQVYAARHDPFWQKQLLKVPTTVEIVRRDRYDLYLQRREEVLASTGIALIMHGRILTDALSDERVIRFFLKLDHLSIQYGDISSELIDALDLALGTKRFYNLLALAI